MAPPVNFGRSIQRGKDVVRSDTPNNLWSPPNFRMIEEFPNSILWISYPASVTIDEERLHNDMILFGEIEGIKNFPSKKYALVKFRSTDEARCAKDRLRGRLLKDPRIIILYANSDHIREYDKCSNSRSMIPDPDVPNWRRLSPATSTSTSGMLPIKLAPDWNANDANQLRPESTRSRTDDGLQGCIWRGYIAKGGSIVCGARCVPVGQGISHLSQVINCSAQTGLDKLTQHYADAVGVEMVFFLPDAERDFPSYTNFLHYLVDKNLAGVVKLDDGTTLFLVPPSDFLTKVLKVVGRQRLYGVVLKFPQVLENVALQTLPSQYGNEQQTPVLDPHATVLSNGTESSDYQTALTPIVGENLQTFSQNWPHNSQTPTYPIPVPQQTSYPLSIPMQSTYQGGYLAPSHPFQGFPTTFSGQPVALNHFQVPSYLPPVGAISSGPFTNSIIPIQSGHRYDVTNGTDSVGLYGQSLHHTTPDFVALSTSVNQPHNVVPPATGNVRTEASNQVQLSFYGAGQEASNSEVGRNQWDQSTLKFMADIVQQIQQIQSGTQTGQVPPNNW